MKLSNKAIESLGDRATILALALALDFSELWITKSIAANKENGPLTTAKALQVIREKTQLSDIEILEETEEAKA